MRYVHGGQPYSEAEIDAWFVRHARNLEEQGACMGAMIEKASGKLVGVAGTQLLGTTGEFEIGWWLVREVWGRGYATEAGRAAMNYVFDVLGRPLVVAIIDPGNEASKRVVERLGMRYESRVTGAQIGHRVPEIVVDYFVKARE